MTENVQQELNKLKSSNTTIPNEINLIRQISEKMNYIMHKQKELTAKDKTDLKSIADHCSKFQSNSLPNGISGKKIQQ